MGDMMLSGMYQMAEPTKTGGAGTLDKEDSFVVSGSYKMDMMTYRGEVLMSTQDMVGGGSIDTTLIGVGVDYNITENTKVFGNLANTKVDTGAADSNTTYLGVGTEVRF
jgi:predicted porin